MTDFLYDLVEYKELSFLHWHAFLFSYLSLFLTSELCMQMVFKTRHLPIADFHQLPTDEFRLSDVDRITFIPDCISS